MNKKLFGQEQFFGSFYPCYYNSMYSSQSNLFWCCLLIFHFHFNPLGIIILLEARQFFVKFILWIHIWSSFWIAQMFFTFFKVIGFFPNCYYNQTLSLQIFENILALVEVGALAEQSRTLWSNQHSNCWKECINKFSVHLECLSRP